MMMMMISAACCHMGEDSVVSSFRCRPGVMKIFHTTFRIFEIWERTKPGTFYRMLVAFQLKITFFLKEAITMCQDTYCDTKQCTSAQLLYCYIGCMFRLINKSKQFCGRTLFNIIIKITCLFGKWAKMLDTSLCKLRRHFMRRPCSPGSVGMCVHQEACDVWCLLL